jgi:hypothetical protein
MKSLSRHLPHYFALFGILIAGIVAFGLFSYDRAFQMAIAVALAASYVAWGIAHHLIHGDLQFSVVVEYLVVATLGLVVIFSLLFRA